MHKNITPCPKFYSDRGRIMLDKIDEYKYNIINNEEVRLMTKDEFNSYNRGIALNTVKLERGEMSQKDFITTMKVILGKEVFQETIQIIDENK
jgi:hypothetical protein